MRKKHLILAIILVLALIAASVLLVACTPPIYVEIQNVMIGDMGTNPGVNFVTAGSRELISFTTYPENKDVAVTLDGVSGADAVLVVTEDEVELVISNTAEHETQFNLVLTPVDPLRGDPHVVIVQINVIPVLHFNTGDGSYIESINVTRGSTILYSEVFQPRNPTLAGHTFEGWYFDAGFTAEMRILPTTNFHVAVDEITVYARFAPYVEISFNMGTGTPIAPVLRGLGQHVVFADFVSQASHPQGMHFQGFYQDAGFTTAVGVAYTVGGAQTFFARWAWEIEFVTERGAFNAGDPTPAQRFFANGQTVRAVDLPVLDNTITHYFVGWRRGTVTVVAFDISANETLEAIWAPFHVPVPATITFNLGFGAYTAIAGSTAYYIGDNFTLPTLAAVGSITSRPHYSFVGWEFAGNQTLVNGSVITLVANTVITARWQRHTFDLEFVYYNAENVRTVWHSEPQIASGTPLSSLHFLGYDPNNVPTRGYDDFVGWDMAIGTVMTSNSTITITAIFDSSDFDVTIISGEGALAADESTTPHQRGQAFVAPAAPERAIGWQFAGWGVGAGATTVEYLPLDNIAVTANIILVGIWEEVYVDVWAYFVLTGEIFESFDVREGAYIYATHPVLVALSQTRVPYHRFTGWNVTLPLLAYSPATGMMTIGATHVMQIELVLETAEVPVSVWGLTGNWAGGVYQIDLGESAVVTLPTPPNAVAAGYFFNFIHFTINGNIYNAGDVFTLSAQTQLIAVWEVATFTVTINDGHGNITQTTVDGGTLVNAPAALDVAGWDFDGWFIDNTTLIAPNTPHKVVADMVFYARNTALITVEFVSLDTRVTNMPLNVTHRVGSISNIVNPGNPTHTEFELAVGWFTNPIDASTLVTWPVDVEAIVAPTTFRFYVLWTGDADIVLDADGGTVWGMLVFNAPQQPVGNTFTLPAPLRGGAYFAGWRIDGVAGDTLHQEGDIITINTSLRFIAVWEFRLTFVPQEGTLAVSSMLVRENAVVYVDDLTAPTPPNVDRRFVGWSLNGNLLQSGDSFVMTSATILIAQWNFYYYDLVIVIADTQTTHQVRRGTVFFGLSGFVPTPDLTTNPGYRFTGWAGITFEPSHTMVGDITVTATWVQVFTVEFISNITTWANTSDIIDVGTTIYFPTNAMINQYHVTGQREFVGIFVNGTLTTETSIVITSNTTIELRWNYVATVSIFVPQAGANQPAAISMVIGQVTNLSTVLATLAEYIGGYTFSAWIINGTMVYNPAYLFTPTANSYLITLVLA